MSSLLLHAGAHETTRADLGAVPLPDRTDSYEPMPHLQLVEMFTDRFRAAGHVIANEQFGMTPNGARMFALIEFSTIAEGPDPIRLAAGLRNSYDKSMKAGAACGGKVFCCDNLVLTGDWFVARKHTTFIHRDIAARLDEFVVSLPQLQEKQAALIETMQQRVISRRAVSEFVMDDKNLTNTRRGKVWAEFNEPREDHGHRYTPWNLYNAYTRVAKETNLATQADVASRAMSSICKRWSLN